MNNNLKACGITLLLIIVNVVLYKVTSEPINIFSVGFLVLSVYAVYRVFNRDLADKPVSRAMTVIAWGLVIFGVFLLLTLYFWFKWMSS